MVHYFIIGLMVIYIIYTLYINEKANKQQGTQHNTESAINIKPKQKHKNNILYLENYKKASDGSN